MMSDLLDYILQLDSYPDWKLQKLTRRHPDNDEVFEIWVCTIFCQINGPFVKYTATAALAAAFAALKAADNGEWQK